MLRVRPDKPLAAPMLDLLRHVHGAAAGLRLSYFVGGAAARDLMLVHVHGFDVPRPTRDVDIGIAVASWDEFDRVKAHLLDTGAFFPVAGMAHRLSFRPSADSRGVPLDILPFAGVQEPDGTLRWPPDRAVLMNMMGFQEALAKAEALGVAEDLVVPVASLPGQALLKLGAWLDRGNTTPRDAIDLLMLFRRYGDAGNVERLYGEKTALLAAADYDVETAGASLLGEDVRAIAAPASHERLSQAFASPTVQDRFLTHVSSGMAATAEDRVARAQALIHAFFSGLAVEKSS